MIVDDVFVGEESMNRLQVIGQSVVGSAEIKPLVLHPGTKIPISSDEKPMRIAEIVLERIAVAERPPIILKIALPGVESLVIKNLG